MRLAFVLFLSALQVPSKQKSTLLGAFYCLRVTKRSRIELRVSKSSVLAPFDKLELVKLTNDY